MQTLGSGAEVFGSLCAYQSEEPVQLSASFFSTLLPLKHQLPSQGAVTGNQSSGPSLGVGTLSVLLVFFGEVYVFTAFIWLHKCLLAGSPLPKELTAQTRGINSFCFTAGQRQLHLWHPQHAPHLQAQPFCPKRGVLPAKAAAKSSDRFAHRGRCLRAPVLHPQTRDLLQFKISNGTKPTLPALAYEPSAGSCSIPLDADVQRATLITVHIIPPSQQSVETNGENRLRFSVRYVPHLAVSQEHPYRSEKGKSWFPWS